jgi:hypothetical protein
MNHVRVGIYRLQEGASIAEIRKRVEEELLPIFRQSPGFVGYEGVQTEDGYLLSLSTWETRAQADAATATAAPWALANLSFLVTLAENYVGAYLFSHAAAPDDAATTPDRTARRARGSAAGEREGGDSAPLPAGYDAPFDPQIEAYLEGAPADEVAALAPPDDLKDPRPAS